MEELYNKFEDYMSDLNYKIKVSMAEMIAKDKELCLIAVDMLDGIEDDVLFDNIRENIREFSKRFGVDFVPMIGRYDCSVKNVLEIIKVGD